MGSGTRPVQTQLKKGAGDRSMGQVQVQEAGKGCNMKMEGRCKRKAYEKAP